MDLIRDVLDKQVSDQRGHPMGKVDGIIAEIHEGQPPRLLWLEVSGTALARRLHPRLGRWGQALARRFSPTHGRSCRIPWSRIHEFGSSIRVDIAAESTTAVAWERWLRDRVIGRIPGA
jgi:sporulation protein YlmC with PRC-barrel domain